MRATRRRHWVPRFVHPFVLITTLVQSSSAMTLTTTVFASAGLLPPRGLASQAHSAGNRREVYWLEYPVCG